MEGTVFTASVVFFYDPTTPPIGSEWEVSGVLDIVGNLELIYSLENPSSATVQLLHPSGKEW